MILNKSSSDASFVSILRGKRPDHNHCPFRDPVDEEVFYGSFEESCIM